MLMLRHPNVVQLEEVFQDEGNVYFVMELCGGGSIADYVDVKPLSESLARYYFLQIVNSVKYCHSQVHRCLCFTRCTIAIRL
jgi:serine/threonine protein kinase